MMTPVIFSKNSMSDILMMGLPCLGKRSYEARQEKKCKDLCIFAWSFPSSFDFELTHESNKL